MKHNHIMHRNGVYHHIFVLMLIKDGRIDMFQQWMQNEEIST